MKRLLFTLLAASMPLAASVQHIGTLFQNNDHGFWLEENVYKPLPYHFDFRFHSEQRWGNNYRTFWHHEYEFLVEYNFIHNFRDWFCLPENSILRGFWIGPGFKEEYSIGRNRHGSVKWHSINVPILEANVWLSWNGWNMRQRMRGEYLDYNDKHFQDYGRFRYRIYLFSPWRLGITEFNPYVSNEMFFRATANELGHVTRIGNYYENRLRTGAIFRLLYGLYGNLWWQWVSERQNPGYHPHWFYSYQIGASIDVAL